VEVLGVLLGVVVTEGVVVLPVDLPLVVGCTFVRVFGVLVLCVVVTEGVFTLVGLEHCG